LNDDKGKARESLMKWPVSVQNDVYPEIGQTKMEIPQACYKLRDVVY
jgi:hypothetical protein